jgi:Holliday junction resolvase RusA-like endonuclease
MLTGPIRMTLRIFYASERPDLDESIILDVLQAKYSKAEDGKPRELVRRGVYVNDRQVRERHVYHAIDKTNPRAEIEIEAMEAQQPAIPGIDLDIPKERPMRVVPCRSDGAPF